MVCVSSKPSPLSHLHRRRRYPISCLRSTIAYRLCEKTILVYSWVFEFTSS
ncbi:hypothetical protein HanXRQr2_Chr01g0028011 [Helianthus annuus]|uniref:Uncharacterized protein n=1 Tax=Helianthus annuus TaxID=4232 RepID=A0A9K3JWY4_HELAN|nr:hypothetical protein HanXRQr2_Chr01g0028011 [Helianthus annuus]